MGLMQPKTPHRIFFLFVAMQSVLPPKGISIRYAYACPFNGVKQAKKEYRLRKKNTLFYSAALQRKTKWISLNADAFNLLILTITLRACSATCLTAGKVCVCVSTIAHLMRLKAEPSTAFI